MSLLYKSGLLSKATLPHLVGHAVRWPFTKSRAALVDGPQRRMLSPLLVVLVLDADTAEEYGWKWSMTWAKLQFGWHEYLCREPNSWYWAAQMLKIRPPEELEERRLEFGRVRTRVCAGWTSARCIECLHDAFKTAHTYM